MLIEYYQAMTGQGLGNYPNSSLRINSPLSIVTMTRKLVNLNAVVLCKDIILNVYS